MSRRAVSCFSVRISSIVSTESSIVLVFISNQNLRIHNVQSSRNNKQNCLDSHCACYTNQKHTSHDSLALASAECMKDAECNSLEVFLNHKTIIPQIQVCARLVCQHNKWHKDSQDSSKIVYELLKKMFSFIYIKSCI